MLLNTSYLQLRVSRNDWSPLVASLLTFFLAIRYFFSSPLVSSRFLFFWQPRVTPRISLIALSRVISNFVIVPPRIRQLLFRSNDFIVFLVVPFHKRPIILPSLLFTRSVPLPSSFPFSFLLPPQSPFSRSSARFRISSRPKLISSPRSLIYLPPPISLARRF